MVANKEEDSFGSDKRNGKPAATIPRYMRARYAYSIAAISGALLSLPFTDVSSVPAWFALAPVFYLVAVAETKRRAAGLAAVFALVWTILSFRFIGSQTWCGVLALSLCTSLYYLAALLAVRALARRGTCSGIFGVAALWILVELARSRVPVFGFPWLLLGHATVEYEHLRQGADLLGVYGLSFLLAACNAVLAFVLLPVLWPQAGAPPGTPLRRRVCAALAACLLLAGLVYGRWRVAELTPRMVEGPELALLQGCVYHKIGRSDDEERAQLESHLAMHARAAKASPFGRPPALICWAETMLPGVYNLDSYGELFRARVKALGVPTAFGADWVFEEDKAISDRVEQRWNNCAFLMDGQSEIRMRYAKRRLVPFGEYIPGQRTFPFLKLLRSITRDTYLPGEAPSGVAQVAGCAIAFNVCVEDAHPDLAREAALDGAEVLLNLTNDGWFAGTSGPAAHLQAARLRAVEVRKPLVRVTNSGISVQIDPLGVAHKPVLESGRSLEPDTEAIGWARLRMLDGAAPFRPTLWLGEVGAAWLATLVLAAGFWMDRKGHT